ncbi:MAG: NAD(P)-dependent oxidoreductase [Eubacteriales bacterium]|nr:NAD(P)-dependent oxidoreductase [Eubacteriales bacterium]
MKSIYASDLWIADVRETLGTLPELDALADRSVLLTGCTGLIVSAVADLLIQWNCANTRKIRIYAAGRSIEKIRERFSPYDREEWFHCVPYDATAVDNRLSGDCDYIIHGAGNSSPHMIVREPVETMLSNFTGLKYLLDHAKESGTECVLYISTSEVYGKKEGNRPFRTDEYGYIDLLDSRSSYSVGKRAAETLCAAYADEYGVKPVIIRPGHIYGPTARPEDRHVSSAWAYAAARGEEIVMKSDGAQIRSYCYCLDSASAILTAMIKGESVRAYNISNPDSIISIRQMGEFIAAEGNSGFRMELPTDAERKGFNPMSNSSLDSGELLGLGWRALFDAKRGFSHTVRILREIAE